MICPHCGMEFEPEVKVEDVPIRKPDVLDGIIKYQLRPKSIQNAIAEHFKLTPNWEAKYNRQFMEWALDGGCVTPEKVKTAANTWRSDKRFNWQIPTLKGIQEHWLDLIGNDIVDETVHVQWQFENPYIEEGEQSATIS